MDVQNKNEWVIKLADRDKKAYRMLFDRYFIPLVRIAAKFLRSESAQDIVQEVFLKIWEKKPVFENERTLKSYLYSAVYHACLNNIRTQKVHNRFLASVREEDYEMAVMDEEIYLRLMAAIEKLPSHYRQVIELSLEGLEASEIAARMSVTIEAVKAYKRRGKQQLREYLGALSFLVFFI